MDSEQYMGDKEEGSHLHERQSLEIMPDKSSQNDADHRLHGNCILGKQNMLSHGRNSSTHTTAFSSGSEGSSSLTNTGSRNDINSQLIGSTSNVVLLFCLMITVANIAILSNTNRTSEKNMQLKGGDHVQVCSEFPNDQTCFEVRDSGDRLIYRMNGGKRYIGFSECGTDAPETPSIQCIGELALSHMETSIWNYRLYKDKDTNSYSIVAGPHQVDLTDEVFRVRHMLQSPYNWIISKEAIPQDRFPNYGLYIRGQFLFDSIK